MFFFAVLDVVLPMLSVQEDGSAMVGGGLGRFSWRAKKHDLEGRVGGFP